MSRATLLLAILLPAAGCASAQAKAPVEPVALEVPSVPPRVIEPVTIAEPPPPPRVDPTMTPAAPTPPPRPRPRAGDTAKPDPKPEVRTDPVEEVPTPPPVAPLRTGAQSNGPEVERQIKDTLSRNKTLLEGIDARSLSDDRRAALESATNSIERAQEALKAGNVVLARSLADSVDRIAKLLVGR